ncbi:AAA family ATPase, partial [Myxococcota bacterium]|nr:AAA family ATPase [Myxococcota bacterium]
LAGTGKTLLTRRLFESLEEEIFDATLLVLLPGAADAQTVLQRFARQLEVDEPEAERAPLLASIYERLAMVHEEGRHSVLIIDDAQTLSAEAVTEVAALLGMEYEEKRMLSLLLVGTPELDTTLTTHAGLHQRIDVRVQLRALSLQDTAAYLTHRIGVAGGQSDLLSSATVEVLYTFGRGRPRLTNTLADNALFESYLAGETVVRPEQVERAASDLGVGIDPGSTYSSPEVVGAPVEGASMSESEGADPQAVQMAGVEQPKDSSTEEVLLLGDDLFGDHALQEDFSLSGLAENGADPIGRVGGECDAPAQAPRLEQSVASTESIDWVEPLAVEVLGGPEEADDLFVELVEA